MENKNSKFAELTINDNFFDDYHMSVVDNNIAAIQANYIITDYIKQNKFKENCVDIREDFFVNFLKKNNVMRDAFIRKHYKGQTTSNRIFMLLNCML